MTTRVRELMVGAWWRKTSGCFYWLALSLLHFLPLRFLSFCRSVFAHCVSCVCLSVCFPFSFLRLPFSFCLCLWICSHFHMVPKWLSRCVSCLGSHTHTHTHPHAHTLKNTHKHKHTPTRTHPQKHTQTHVDGNCNKHFARFGWREN